MIMTSRAYLAWRKAEFRKKLLVSFVLVATIEYYLSIETSPQTTKKLQQCRTDYLLYIHVKRQQSFEKYYKRTCSNIKAQQSQSGSQYNVWLLLWNNTSLTSSNIPQFFYICSSCALRFSVLIELRSRVHIQQRNEPFSGPPTENLNLIMSSFIGVLFLRILQNLQKLTIHQLCHTILWYLNNLFCVSKCRFESINRYISAFLSSKEIMG